MVPLISVIVVTYNRARFLKEALESIKRQTFKDYEIILVDDGSTDNTREIAKEYPGIRYIYQEHGGISRARNTALKATRGKWIATLDSDDLWGTDKLQKQVDYLHAHPDCRIVFTDYSNFTDIPEDKLDRRQRDLLQTVIKWCLPTALIDSRLFDEIGLFDEAMEYSEDTDWIFRLKFYKVNVEHCIEESLYLRRVHSSNISNSIKEICNKDMQKMAIDAYRKVRRLRKNN
jgi:glycosyltransferase involved in cell wall biosynthesis